MQTITMIFFIQGQITSQQSVIQRRKMLQPKEYALWLEKEKMNCIQTMPLILNPRNNKIEHKVNDC